MVAEMSALVARQTIAASAPSEITKAYQRCRLNCHRRDRTVFATWAFVLMSVRLALTVCHPRRPILREKSDADRIVRPPSHRTLTAQFAIV
jgi:hypothetical protein